jgi:hypothetical protein
MAIESQLDLVGAVLILVGGIIPAYLSIKLKGDIARVTIALTAFILAHGIYHVVRMQGMEEVADGILEPASVLLLIAFGVIYLGMSNKKKKNIAKGGQE